MEAKIYNSEGKEAGAIKLPDNVFGEPWNQNLVHEVVVSMASNKRQGTAHVKDRGEVRGGGRKPWRQKGTGRARHGSIRSPIWVGGGVTHGPNKEKNFTKKINKKKKAKALYSILSRKLKDNEILFLDSFQVDKPKTSEAKKILINLSQISGFGNLLKKKENSALFSFEKRDQNTQKSLRNFANIVVQDIKDINPLLLLQYKYLIITNPKVALDQISGKLRN